MKKQEAGEAPDNVFGMFTNLMEKIKSNTIKPERFEKFLKIGDYPGSIVGWQIFYRDVFGMKTDFSDLPVPEKQAGLDRLLIVAQGMLPQRLFNKSSEFFPCWKWNGDDLDKNIKSDRTAKDGAYAIWVRNHAEADEELKKVSADRLKKKNIPGITLEEQLVFELKFFKETGGEHLDVASWTLCAGSRHCTGDVPSTNWGGVGFGVCLVDPDYADNRVYSRRVVS